MADLIDGAGSTAGQVVREVGRGSATVAKGATRLSVRVAGGMFKGVGSLYSVARKAARSRATTGEVRLKVFTREAHGKREVVPVKDADVARMFVRELRRHGVLFAVERHRDGTRTFHVQGQDASVIEHALSVAIARVDASLARLQAPDRDVDPAPGERVLNLTDEQKATLVETLRSTPEDPAVDKAPAAELADQVERDGAVVLTEENVDTIDAALGEPGEEPAALSEVADAVAEEKVAIAAGAEDATRDLAVPEDAPEIPGEPVPVELPAGEDLDSTVTVVLGDRERDTLVEGLQNAAAVDQTVDPERLTVLAETVEQESRVVLTPENIATLEQAFAAHGWTPGADDDSTPEHMRWIVEAVSEERQGLTVAPVLDPSEPERPTSVVEDTAIAPAGESIVQGEAPDSEAPTVAANPFLTDDPAVDAEPAVPFNAADARDAYAVGALDRDYLEEAERRGHRAPLQARELEDVDRIRSVSYRAILADDLRTLPREDLEEVYRIAGRWNGTNASILRELESFDETVSRPDRSVQLPTTRDVAESSSFSRGPGEDRATAEAPVPPGAAEYEAELGPFNPDDLPQPEPDPFDSDPAAWGTPDDGIPAPRETSVAVNPYLTTTEGRAAKASDPYLAAAEAGTVGTDERWLQLEERMLEPLPEPSPEVAAVMAEMIQGDHDQVVYTMLDNMKVQPSADPARTLAIIRGASELHVNPDAPTTKAALEVVEAMRKPGLFEGSVHETAARRLSSVLQTVPDPSRTAEAVQLGLSRRETTRDRLAARIQTKAAELKATYAAQALQQPRRSRGASKGK